MSINWENDNRPKRSDFATDKEFFDTFLKGEFEWGKKQREALPYSRTDEMKPRISLIGPGFQTAHLDLVWNGENEKYSLMAKTAYLARAIEAKGVSVVSDVRFCRMDEFKIHFHLPEYSNDEAGIKQMQADYLRIIREHGGSMGNLPRHLWCEAVHAAIKTPQFGDQGMVEPYTKGSKDRIMWIPRDLQMDGAEMRMVMLKNWWEIPENDPHLKRAREVCKTLIDLMMTGRI